MFRRILPPTLLATLLLSGCATQKTAKFTRHSNREIAVGNLKTVRTTAYTSSEPGGSHSACGTRLCSTNKEGRIKSAAADWSRFPLGTQFKILSTGEIYEVCDYGSALVRKNTIDLYKNSRREVRQWGARSVVIMILRWGSFEKSREVLAPRSHSHHVQLMLADLREE